MEGMNYLTSGDLALFSEAKYGKSAGYDGYCYGHRRDGMAATGIGLAAGLGGAALIGVLAVGWGVNQASKARSRAAENAAVRMRQLQRLNPDVGRRCARHRFPALHHVLKKET